MASGSEQHGFLKHRGGELLYARDSAFALGDAGDVAMPLARSSDM